MSKSRISFSAGSSARGNSRANTTQVQFNDKITGKVNQHIGGLVSVRGITNLKKPDYLYLVLGFILYGTLGLVYQRMLASGQTLILANIIWQGATVVAMGIIGYFVFGQTLTTKETIATVGILLLMLLLK